MSKQLPTIQITPAMAVRFARKCHFAASTATASSWLLRNKIEIERRLLERAQCAIEDVLFDVTLWEWPDPEANKMHHQIEDAIFEAIAKHEEAFNLESMCESTDEEKMKKIVRSFLRHRGTKAKKAFLVVSLSFRKTDSLPSADCPEVPYLVELTYYRGSVSAILGERMIYPERQ